MAEHVRPSQPFASLLGSLLILAGALPLAAAPVAAVSTTLVINEIDYDQPSIDTAEFLELKNVGASAAGLNGFTVEMVNGTGGGAAIYRTFALPDVTLAAGDYYVICANPANTANCDLDVTPETDLIQNGAPDAIGLRFSGALVDAVSYEGDSGAPYVEGTGSGLVDTGANANESISRCADGVDTDQNNVDLSVHPSTPGTSNACVPVGGDLVINEIDYDQPSTDTAEYLELKNVGTSVAGLNGFTVQLVNGDAGGAVVYLTIALPDVTLVAGGYYVICANPATTANCDLDVSPETNLIQNGAPDAIGLRFSGALVDAVSYEGNSGAPYVEGSGVGLADTDAAGESISRCPDGTDTDQNNADFILRLITPGASNYCPGPGTVLRIREIQGSAHLSPYAGQRAVDVPGIVTATSAAGFWFQDPAPDADAATSEGIFVFTGSAPPVSAGDSVLVSGNVSEFRPGGSSTANLTTTELTAPSVAVLSSGNALPAATIVGVGGRVPPNAVIEDDATGSVETSGIFDPAADGIDFYESLEGMRLQVNGAVVVGPTNDFGELWVLPDDGAGASIRTNRDGIVIQASDLNPERIQLDDALNPGGSPLVNVGDHFTGPIVGVLDYNFGNFELLPSAFPGTLADGVTRETTTATTDPDDVTVGTFNVENLDPGDPQSHFDDLAELIVNNLQAPDLLSLEEIQDNNGPTNDAEVDADVTLQRLVDAIAAAGGPTYHFRQINPVDDQDGGEPGGNIRVGFLFRTDRGLSFVDRPGGGPTTATTVTGTPGAPQLSASPGRISPTDPAFTDSRKPLAGEFMFNGHHLFVVANHFNSKGGDHPLFGRFQPPVLSSEVQRLQQAHIVNDFVDDIVALDPNAEIVVLGDLNDFEWSPPLLALRGDVLNILIETLPKPERYTYVFEGNSQALDHILVSDALFDGLFAYDSVHVNAEFSDQASDHDPQVVRMTLWEWGGLQAPIDEPPTMNTVNAGSTVPVKFSLDGNQGLAILAEDYPVSVPIECDTGEPTGAAEETMTPGRMSLQYDAGTDTYTYLWKTAMSWTDTCRRLTVGLADGSFHHAEFHFVR